MQPSTRGHDRCFSIIVTKPLRQKKRYWGLRFTIQTYLFSEVSHVSCYRNFKMWNVGNCIFFFFFKSNLHKLWKINMSAHCDSVALNMQVFRFFFLRSTSSSLVAFPWWVAEMTWSQPSLHFKLLSRATPTQNSVSKKRRKSVVEK